MRAGSFGQWPQDDAARQLVFFCIARYHDGMQIMVHRKIHGTPSERWVQFVLKAIAKRISAKQRERIKNCAVIFVGDARMRTLNRVHRGQDRATDVLAFPGTDGELGDIVIAVPYVRRQARRFSVSFKEECARMLIHGTLHLLGYDHHLPTQARRMFKLQEAVVDDIL